MCCVACGQPSAKVDRKAGQATIIEPPTPNQSARRVWSDSKGDLWISEWNSGQLSRYSPATKAWKSWKLPGDEPKAYAVYVDEQDIVWVTTTSALRPVIRPGGRRVDVDPAPGANVRQILGRPGEVYLPESGTNRVMLVRKGAVRPCNACLHDAGRLRSKQQASDAEQMARGERACKNATAAMRWRPGRNDLQGPTLYRIVGRSIAAEPGFSYSPAMRRFAETEQSWGRVFSTSSLPIPKLGCPEPA